jgi:hypothetical protein
MAIVYWIATALFCLQMSLTAYAQLRLPQVAEAFTHLGFPAYFRVGLTWAKLLGSAWCCCLRRCRRGSRSGPTPASPSTVGGHRRALGLSYFFWRRLQATPASA